MPSLLSWLDVVVTTGTVVDVTVVMETVGAMVVIGTKVVETGGAAVLQLVPLQPLTLMSAQFQNFSAPLPLVLGSPTFAGQVAFVEPHHELASPPNLDWIHALVESFPKYSWKPGGEHELAETQKN